ncbi:tyrosine-type recombinase/integrase [Rhizobium leguminosarum]|uniref:tyrosine-type recombinase/integrase n=1 Tax=Rhizobium leguminosarum TaxID=384 RepID=UPI001C9837E4|nr:tyrosine-type recombinase/integrase [Rhizobium leguminosarum]MBY5771438.1 tyrosine-type recombinase/integrase [Rhizobium leguminosarum]
MANPIGTMSEKEVAAKVKAGRFGDGGNLSLVVKETGSRSWAFIYRQKQPNGKPSKTVELGLGPYISVKDQKEGVKVAFVTLKQARALAAECRDWLAMGKDPKAERAAARAPVEVVESTIPTFGKFADGWIAETIKPGLKNAKHIAQWETTMSDTYIASLRKVRIDCVTDDDVIAAVKPLWDDTRETASRILGRIARALTEAKARKLRTGDNPAEWDLVKGRLGGGKQKRSHHSALPYRDMPTFMTALRSRIGTAARCLEFTILTAARSGEAFGAVWSEIDFDNATWTVPAERMKMGLEHNVPLSDAAIAVLELMKPKHFKKTDFIFPGTKEGKPLSTMAMDMTIRRLEEAGHCGDITTHGMRSAFRDWSGSQTDYPRDLCEEALAHAVGDATERAYRREQAIEKRRPMMTDWANYCAGVASNVILLANRRA